MNRILLIPTAALLLLGVIAFFLSRDPASSAADPADRPIFFANADAVKTLDVGKMSWANDIRTAMGLWEGLTNYEPKTLKILPGVASTWDISADGKTYTFHLRPDARWSNGDPVVAKDFLFAWQRVLTPSTGADYINLFFPIVGAEDYYNALDKKLPANFSKVGVSAPDSHTLIVRLVNPCTYLLDLCAFPPFFPLHEGAMKPYLLDKDDPTKGYDGAWTRPPHLVSNGAFYLKDWQFKRHLFLAPNPKYWDRANVKTSGIMVVAYEDPRTALLAFQDGTIDIMSWVPKQFGEELLQQRDSGKRHDIDFRPVFGTYYYIFNCTKAPLTDKRVRKALALSIDKKQIVEKITRMGEAPCGVIVAPNAIRGYNQFGASDTKPLDGIPAGLPMNIELAQKLLADAGFPGGKGFPTLEILVNSESIHLPTAQAIGQMWHNNLGIEVSYRSLERGSFGSDRRASNFTVARGGWYGDYADPTTWLDLLKTGDGNNDGKFSSPPYDALLAQAAAEADPAIRFAKLRAAERLITEEEFPLIPLYQYSDGFIYDPKKIDYLDANVRLLTPFKWLRRFPKN